MASPGWLARSTPRSPPTTSSVQCINSTIFAGAEQRLRDFLVFRFGGPSRYIEERGHPRLRMRHAPFQVDRSARDRWVALMDRALDQAGLPAEAEAVLRGFFHDTADFLVNRRG